MITDNYDQSARVLVAVVTRPADLLAAREQGWYRIPLAHAPYPLAADLVAFYQTAAFGDERWSVRYLAAIERYQITTRRDLLPHESEHPRANQRYYRLSLGSLHTLLRPVPSRRLRRVTFIPTTLGLLLGANDLVELWHPSRQPAPTDVWGAGIGTTRRK